MLKRLWTWLVYLWTGRRETVTVGFQPPVVTATPTRLQLVGNSAVLPRNWKPGGSALSKSERAVLSCMLGLPRDDQGRFGRSTRELGKMTGFSEATAGWARRGLESRGLIVKAGRDRNVALFKTGAALSYPAVANA